LILQSAVLLWIDWPGQISAVLLRLRNPAFVDKPANLSFRGKKGFLGIGELVLDESY
jgi:hypothetical protein